MNLKEVSGQSLPAFDIIVAGAGPAGSTFVLSMLDLPYSIAVIDKAVFPRDKVCGDAIPGRAVRVIRSFGGEISERFTNFQQKYRISGAKAITPGGKSLELYYQTEGYTSARAEFDNFLFREAQAHPEATFFQGHTIQSVIAADQWVEVRTKEDSQPIRGRLIIGADGANSVVARQLAARRVDPLHHCGAVRAYFRDVQGIDEGRIEAFLLKDYLPGYFWIFPLPNGIYNVGFGMLSKDIAAKRINLRDSFLRIIREDSKVQSLFQAAEQIGEVQGFGLPLGSRRRSISGERYMLAGDAASLIDPATGEGIGNAMLSARVAAEVAAKCLEADNFSTSFLKQYDRMVYGKLWPELRNKYLIQRLLKDRAWLIDLLVGQVANSPILQNITKRIF